jgi:hypothetical protein
MPRSLRYFDTNLKQFESMIRATVTAMAWQLGRSKAGSLGTFDAETAFLLQQMRRMPDYLRLPFRMLTLFFGYHTLSFYGRTFPALSSTQRDKVIRAWKNASLSFMPTFIRFFEGLVTVHVHSRQDVQ